MLFWVILLRIVMIIAKQGFRDEEFLLPFDFFRKNGANVDVASTEEGECIGKLGAKVNSDLAFDDVNPEDYNAILLVGGPGSHELVGNPKLEGIIKRAVSSGLVVGAICFAPVILGKAGVLEGKKVTAWNKDGKQKPVLEQSGAEFLDEDVIVDGKLVTANGPESAKEFAETIFKRLESG
jgi:protease I